jgi:hypothetical protein
MNIITTIASNWQEIGAAVALIMAGARGIVMLTPTPKDDGVLDSIVSVLKKIGLHIEKK